MDLFEQCELSTIVEKFLKLDVTVDIVWSLEEDILSQLELNRMERLKYDEAKKKYGENKGNLDRLKGIILNLSKCFR